jgi:deazaflavin-dependent oxidoreductase (nitroreductase family)
MAKTYEVTGFRRTVNKAMSALARRGKGPASELTVVGRRSGTPQTVPVTPIEVDGERYLVAPYGAVGWVHNIRATGTGSLSRGGITEEITVEECMAEDSGPVLLQYHRDLERIVGPYFDVPEDPTGDDFSKVAGGHPVFRYVETPTPGSKTEK